MTDSFSRSGVTRRVFGLLGLGAAGIVTARSEKPNSVASWYPLDLTSSRYITYPIRLNGQAVRAVIDTGATRSVISRLLVKSLGLTATGQTAGRGVTGQLIFTLVRVGRLEVENIELADVTVATFDDPPPALGAYPFILGQDVLRRIPLRIQFPRDRITAAAALVSEADGFARVPLFEPARLAPTVRVRVERQNDASALIDLGNNVLCSTSEAFAASALNLGSRRVSTTMTSGLEGAVIGPLFALDELNLEPFSLRSVSVAVLRNWNVEQDLILGWPLFRAFDMAFPAGYREVLLAADEQLLAEPLPRDRSGLGATRLPDRLVVRHVGLASPAEKAGLVPGNAIIAIDGRRIDPSFPAPGDRQGYRPAGTRLRLELDTGRTVELTLTDYY